MTRSSDGDKNILSKKSWPAPNINKATRMALFRSSYSHVSGFSFCLIAWFAIKPIKYWRVFSVAGLSTMLMCSRKAH